MSTFKSLDEFRVKLKTVAEKEFVQSMRKGDTGIGYTLESLLGIKENNVPLADLGDIELKAYRKGSSSMLLRFQNPKDTILPRIPLIFQGRGKEGRYPLSPETSVALFTCEPKPAGGERDKMLLQEFGYLSAKKGRAKELYCTINASRFNNQSLKLSVEKNVIRVTSSKKHRDVYWDFEALSDSIRRFKN